MPYCTDANLLSYHPNIFGYGFQDWAVQHETATLLINREVEVWYKEKQTDYETIPFDPDLLLNADKQLKLLAVYLTLSLCFSFLTKGQTENDTFMNLEKYFYDKYTKELQAVLASGLSYDFDRSGAIDQDETKPFSNFTVLMRV